MLGSVTFGGLASGLPTDLVDQLMSAQQTRKKTLERDRDYFTKQLSTYDTLVSKLKSFQSTVEDLQSASSFSPHTASSSDTTRISISSDSTAVEGNHSVEVQRLATNATFVADTGTAALTDTLGQAGGTFDFSYIGSGGTPEAISVAFNSTDTLSDLVSKINSAAFTSGSGFSAGVMYDGSQYRLTLTAKDAGAGVRAADGTTTTSRISAVSFSANDAFASITQTRAGVDAQMKVDGVSNIYSSSNSVNNVLTGVTMSLGQVSSGVVPGGAGVGAATGSDNQLGGTGTDIMISISNDSTTLKTTLDSFVTAYNDVINFISGQKEQYFSGESLTRSIVSQMRSVINTPTGDGSGGTLTPYSTLAEIGLRTDQKLGTISFDSTKLDAAISSNFKAISSIFTTTDATGNDGVAHRMADLLSGITDSTDGSVTARQDGLQNRIDSQQERIDKETIRLDAEKERLTLKFATLERLITQMKGSSGSLESTLSSLNSK
ncbi:MAG: flagellar filament capping protein FliD [Magnetococcus sp. DMHC-6]